MKIHPLWFICIFVRLSLIYFVMYLNKKRNKKTNMICASILLIMGIGFVYKGLTGSNNELQVNKFLARNPLCTWYVLSFIFILSSFAITDVIFSFLFRFILKK